MRLWSLHPFYLDAKGLVALWREGLLAQKVLQGQTHGYRHHSQLIRFQAQKEPELAIKSYLWGVYEESVLRGYHFDVSKLSRKPQKLKMQVTDGQLQYELNHLLRKLKQRDMDRYKSLVSVKTPLAHPLFRVVPGAVETWERIE
jgi:hypothetical protein